MKKLSQSNHCLVILCWTSLIVWGVCRHVHTHTDVFGTGHRNLDSSVGIATGYGLADRGSILGRGKRCFFLPKVKTGSGVHQASYPMHSE
jgi:hypothetical protein